MRENATYVSEGFPSLFLNNRSQTNRPILPIPFYYPVLSQPAVAGFESPAADPSTCGSPTPTPTSGEQNRITTCRMITIISLILLILYYIDIINIINTRLLGVSFSCTSKLNRIRSTKQLHCTRSNRLSSSGAIHWFQHILGH